MVKAFILVLSLLSLPAEAHDVWANGEAVPEWVKRACCGPTDYHALTREQIRATPDGWHIDGHRDPVPFGSELPSPDGGYHAFWTEFADGTQSRVFCLFLPPSST